MIRHCTFSVIAESTFEYFQDAPSGNVREKKHNLELKYWPLEGMKEVVASSLPSTVSCKLFRSASGNRTRESLIVHWQWIWALAQAIVSIPKTFLRVKCELITWLVRGSPPLSADLFNVFVKVIWHRIGSPAKYTEPRNKRTSISTILAGDEPLDWGF